MRVIDYFDQAAARTPDRALLLGADDRELTFAAAQRRSHELARALHADGLAVGDTVGVLAPNDPDAFVAMLGLWRAGAAWAPLNHLNALGANGDYMNDVACRRLYVHPRFADAVAPLRAAVPGLTSVVSLGDPFPGAIGLREHLATGDGTTLPDWADPFGSPDRHCCYWPTGGTTGRSKAVIWTNQVWATLNELTTRHWPTVPDPVNLMVAPMTHAAGVMAVILGSVGATVVVRPGFDADDVLDRIERHRVTHLFLPPTAYYALLDAQRARPRDVSSLALLLVAAAPVSPDRMGEGVEVFGPCVAQCWGQGESPFLLTYLAPEEVAAAVAAGRRDRLASCGRATFSCQVAVADDDGRLLDPGETGELVVRGRLVAPGYLGRPQATAEVQAHGWHHTGDVGRIDEDGYVSIVDRKKEMIISGGFNVFPAEVETALLTAPAVADCAVIGVPDDRWGEAVTAFVVLRDGADEDAEGLIAHARAALGPVKAPKRIAFVTDLPRTPVGKTDKRALRRAHWSGRERAVN
ncbi:AMP-binding protein [Patulibacter defluvii]|uniref:AMP-binding protein n=1 Tax=Patulibacter defluvii TaxID=3095358 RepID=UPI002A74D8D6|nr:AMP-binding protein [Patulibacter sp. DM4]